MSIVSQSEREPELVKVRVDLPNHWAVGGESMWAVALGEDLYRIDNVPFHAYGLNLGDVVVAVAEKPELKPEVLRVVRPSGHRTLRIVFFEPTTDATRDELSAAILDLGASVERADSTLWAVDCPPDVNMEALCDQFDDWETRGLIDWEDGGERLPGSFDDAPDNDTQGDGLT